MVVAVVVVVVALLVVLVVVVEVEVVVAVVVVAVVVVAVGCCACGVYISKDDAVKVACTCAKTMQKQSAFGATCTCINGYARSCMSMCAWLRSCAGFTPCSHSFVYVYMYRSCLYCSSSMSVAHPTPVNHIAMRNAQRR